MKRLLLALVVGLLLTACTQPTAPPDPTRVAPAKVLKAPRAASLTRYILISGNTPPPGCVESQERPGYWEC